MPLGPQPGKARIGCLKSGDLSARELILGTLRGRDVRVFSCQSPRSSAGLGSFRQPVDRWSRVRPSAPFLIGRIALRAAGLLAPILAPILVTTLVLAAEARAQWPAEIRGRVIDAATSAGLGSVRVTVDGTAASVLTRGDGGFHLRSLEPGTVRLGFRRVGYAPADTSVVVRTGTTLPLVVRLAPVAVPLDAVRVDAERVRPRRSPSVHVLDRARIRASGAGSVGELVASLPGASLVERGPGGEQTLQVRGAAADQVLVLVDGTPLNDPVSGRADLSTIPVERIVRIEYRPGAGSAREGRGALAGVLYVTTTGAVAPIEGLLAVGSLGDHRVSLGTALHFGPVQTSLDLRLARVEGRFPFSRDERVGGGAGVRENAGRSEQGAELRLASGSEADRSQWELALGADRLQRGIPGKSYAPSRHARQSLEQGTLRGRFVHRLDAEVGVANPPARSTSELRIDGGLELRRLHFLDPAPPIGPAFDDRSRIRAVDVGVEVEGGGGPVRIGRWTGGVDVRHLSLASDLLASEHSPVRMFEAGAFGRGERHFPGLPLAPRVGLAARVDRGPGGVVASHDLSVGVTPVPQVRIDFSHRSAWSPPAASDQFFREGVGVEPNPDLRGERIPAELELAWSLAVRLGGLRADVFGSAFRSDIRDHIVWAPDFRFVWTPRNIDVRRRGWDVGALLLFPWNLRASGQFSDSRVRYLGRDGTTGSQVAYRPRHSAALSAAWSGGGWRMNITSNYVGARYPVPAPVNELPGFWTTSLAVSGTLRWGGWHVEPVLRVRRLLDERAPFIFSVPEAGRTVRLELRIGRHSSG